MIGKIVNARCPLCRGPLEVGPSGDKLICYAKDSHRSGKYQTIRLPIDLQLRLMHQPELPGLDMPELKVKPAAFAKWGFEIKGW